MGKSKEVVKFDMYGNEICRYYNLQKACEDNNISKYVLRNALGKDKYINGFKYSYSGRYSDEVDKSCWKFKCPYCDDVFQTYNGLCKHVFRFSNHECESKEKLLSDFAYNGERPKCRCGCGEYTDISYEGGAHFCNYKAGHSSRINNNWGHNSKAIKNSANTRREQYSNGERKQWNFGRTWKETFSEDKIIEYREVIREKLLNRIKNKTFSISSKLEEYFINEFIIPLNVEYERQYYLKDIHQYCDIYIPSHNLVIECDGSFWHSDKRLFPNGPKYSYQKKKVELDEIKNDYLLSNGYKLLRIWEIDILKNKDFVRNEISKIINKDNS